MHISNDLLSHHNNPVSPASNFNTKNFPTGSFASSLGKHIKPKEYFEGMNIQSFFVTKVDKSQCTTQPYRLNKKKQD